MTSTQGSGSDWLHQAATDVAHIARQAGALIMRLYDMHEYQTYEKADDSPVTSADMAANKFIIEALESLTPEIPILSEESGHVDFNQRKHWPRYWLIDPIDGTQEFIARSGDFAVNIALVEGNKPVLGIIYWPAGDTLYKGIAGVGAFKQDAQGETAIQVRKLDDPSSDPLIIAISRRQPQERVSRRMSGERKVKPLPAGSCSLKACFIAEGKADCFLRVGPTGEWDTAASQVIVHEAGGRIVSEDFAPLTYNETIGLGNPNFLILGDPAVVWEDIFIKHKG